MNFYKIIFVGIATLSASTILATTDTVANASKAVSIPSSLRGTWYNYNSGTGQYNKVSMTKYHFNSGTIHLSGVKYPKYAMGHPQMFVSKSRKGYYNIGKYATDEWPSWKRVTHKGHAALRSLVFAGPGYYTYYYYQSKTIAKRPTESGIVYKGHYKVAKYSGFTSNGYRTGYIDDPETSLKFYKYDSVLEKPGSKYAFTIKNSLTPLRVKNLKKNSNGDMLLDVVYGSTHAAALDYSDYHTVLPYNTDKVNGSTVTSRTTPYSGKAVLKHGINTKKIKAWMTDRPGNKSAFYRRVKGGWKYIGTI